MLGRLCPLCLFLMIYLDLVCNVAEFEHRQMMALKVFFLRLCWKAQFFTFSIVPKLRVKITLCNTERLFQFLIHF